MWPRQGGRTSRPLHLCGHYRGYGSNRFSRRPLFPHGFSSNEPLVPPSKDNSTPITDALPRSPFLDPTSYKPKKSFIIEPRPKDASGLSELEKQIIYNPFAQILASPCRADRFGRSVLPKDLLIKFSVFRQPDTEQEWILPSDLLHDSPRVSGVYRLNWKPAIEELGDRTKGRKWKYMTLRPEENGKRNLVWRDGMSDHILGIMRDEAQKQLNNLCWEHLFHATVDASLKTAIVGSGIGRKLHGDSETPANETVSTEERQWSTAQSHISAILYLGSPDLHNPWEFKIISVENQSTQAILINLRRLFPLAAESFFVSRVESGNAIAVLSSQQTCRSLQLLLRLSFYIEGDPNTDMTLEERNKVKNLERINM